LKEKGMLRNRWCSEGVGSRNGAPADIVTMRWCLFFQSKV